MLTPSRAGMLLSLFAALLLHVTMLQGEELKPFAPDAKTPGRAKLSPNRKPYHAALELTAANQQDAWQLVGMARVSNVPLHQLETRDGQPALRLHTSVFDPEETILETTLPTTSNGDVWAKYQADYLAFRCQSSAGAVTLNLHLTLRGKTAGQSGSYRAFFVAQPGKWQQIVLPFSAFNLDKTGRIESLGVSLHTRPAAGADVQVWLTDFQVGSARYDSKTLAGQAAVASLKGDWRFRTDPTNEGLSKNFHQPDYLDDDWQTLKAGTSWSQQGIRYGGYAWYRQQLAIPTEMTGAPLQLELARIPYEDEVWVNGVRIGGLRGEYKFQNVEDRLYTAPPSVLRYGQTNTIAIRVWGVATASWTYRDNNGLIDGPYRATLDPCAPLIRRAGASAGEAVPVQSFDFTHAQRDLPCEMLCPFPAGMLEGNSARLQYTLTDHYGQLIASGQTDVQTAGDLAVGVLPLDAAALRTIYLRSRFFLTTALHTADGAVLCTDTREFDHLQFRARDAEPLPTLPPTQHDTPFGQLTLIDEIDCATPITDDPHPYLESGYEHAQRFNSPGSPAQVNVREILGKPARENGYGYFAYRIGRGRLKPRGAYLLRIEYPEDQPRYCPVEVQAGLNYMDIGWKNGVSADDPYDNWPLSGQWQWYDAVVMLDDVTAGSGGAGDGDASAGVWVYFMNKLKPQLYFSMYPAGPAVGRIRLYELDPEKHAARLNFPAGQPHRKFMMDWERQAVIEPLDTVRYCKLMGYNAVAPIILKWHFMNFGAPMAGYESHNMDERGYWLRQSNTERGKVTTPALADHPSMHDRFLDATRQLGVEYIPRFEYGGSLDLPAEAYAIAANAQVAKPTRFSSWGANILHPASWEDLYATVEHLIKPYVQANPQMTGLLWRQRCDRMQISYGRRDVELFAQETGLDLPDLTNAQLADWASSGERGWRYADWWHAKRRDFHVKLLQLLKSYRADLTLYYYNWDNDKWWMGLADTNSAAYFMDVAKSRPGMVPSVYAMNVRQRKAFTGEDYVYMIRTGVFGESPGWGHDWGLHTELYRDVKDLRLFAPANYRYLADNPTYLNYFQSNQGLAVSYAVSYDEMASRYINPKYEGNMMTAGGPDFAMALELLAYFHGDADVLTYTAYTYGRGFAPAQRRFAQAFLALPAVKGAVIDQPDADVKVRAYPGSEGSYLGIAHKGHVGKTLKLALPGSWRSAPQVLDVVTQQPMAAQVADGKLLLELPTRPMELHALWVK